MRCINQYPRRATSGGDSACRFIAENAGHILCPRFPFADFLQSDPTPTDLYMTFSFLRKFACAFPMHQEMVAGFYGSRRSAVELPGGVNDSSSHEKVDYSCFSALCSGDGAGFLREPCRR